MMNFIQLVNAECQAHGVELHLPATETVYMPTNAAKCAGFFDGKNKRLACAMARADWIEILAHEFSHFQQWKEGLFPIGNSDPCDLLEEWYSGKEYTKEQVEAAIVFVMSCELDAEKRAVGYICQYGLSTNISEYISCANGYVLLHLYAQKHRKWPEAPEWGDSLPRDRMLDLDEVKLTKELEALILKAQPAAQKKAARAKKKETPKEIDFGA
jgi:hypothetical protein